MLRCASTSPGQARLDAVSMILPLRTDWRRSARSVDARVRAAFGGGLERLAALRSFRAGAVSAAFARWAAIADLRLLGTRAGESAGARVAFTFLGHWKTPLVTLVECM